jgi:hypothetical protein
MDFKMARDMIGVIGTERRDRFNRLKNEEPDFAHDQWLSDESFISDMCLMVLVALRHQLERELIFLAARANVDTITHQEYRQKIIGLRQEIKENGWKNLIKTLNLDSFAVWRTSMETLRLLANCVKHEPTQEPDEMLLKHLNLPSKPTGPMLVGYAPVPDSDSFREGLAVSVDLELDADYCTIAEAFAILTDQFLKQVRQETKLARVTGSLSLTEFVG